MDFEEEWWRYTPTSETNTHNWLLFRLNSADRKQIADQESKDGLDAQKLVSVIVVLLQISRKSFSKNASLKSTKQV